VRRMAHLLHKVGIKAPLDTPRGVADGLEGYAAIKEFADEVVKILQELLKFAEQGTPEWNELFSGLRVGFLALSSGLGPLATELGLLVRKGPPAWRRIKLGTQLYCVVPGPTAVVAVVDRVASMLHAAFSVEVDSMVGTWPSTAEEVPGFLEHGLSVVKEIRRVGGLMGGQSEKHQYLVLSFVRSALVAQIAARLPGAMDTHTMAQVAQYLASISPVSRQYLASISPVSSRYLASISQVSRQYLVSISPVSRQYSVSHQRLTRFIRVAGAAADGRMRHGSISPVYRQYLGCI
jgi:hypothetical protein